MSGKPIAAINRKLHNFHGGIFEFFPPGICSPPPFAGELCAGFFFWGAFAMKLTWSVFDPMRPGKLPWGVIETVGRAGPVSIKRHRAAALHDAGAFSETPPFPQGFGVQRPYAAFIENRTDCPTHLRGIDVIIPAQ